MKKKLIIATLLAGVLAAACFTGYTCKGNNDDEKEEQEEQQEQGYFEKGEQVSAEQWTTAINATLSLKNYSLYAVMNDPVTAVGNYQNYIPVNVVLGTKHDIYMFNDLDNNVSCGNNKQTDWVKGFADLYTLGYFSSEDIDPLSVFLSEHSDYTYGLYGNEDKERTYITDRYQVRIDEDVYVAFKSSSKDVWEAEKGNNSAIIDLSALLVAQVATEEDGEVKPFSEMYNDFVYSDGIYTAKLWFIGVEWTYSVSFKDGYVLCVSMKKIKTEEEEGITFTAVDEMIMKIYDIGKTTPKPSAEAVKAVEDYIKENY